MVRRGYCNLQGDYRPEVLSAMKNFVPRQVLPQGLAGQRLWHAWELILAAVLVAWSRSSTAGDRFDEARLSLRQWWPKKALGETYSGFIKALVRFSELLLQAVTAALRRAMVEVAGPHRRREGWEAFAVDGSRIECPRTAANEAVLHRAGRQKTGPQVFLTVLYHMGTGLPWAFRTGPGTDSERTHLREMLGELPAESLAVADAGFMGYELLSELLESGRHALFRVGHNVTLLRELGYAMEPRGDTVYLWPQAAQKGSWPPLVLRLIVVGKGRHRVYLVTDLPEEALSQEQAEVLYRLRWGVEVFYRSLKQTLGRRRMLSHAPQQALCEVAWSLVGLWLLGLMSVQEIVRRGKDPLGLSVALALRHVRQALRQDRRSVDGRWLQQGLAAALKDGYRRRGPKKARSWPHKKRERPPGAPKILIAAQEQVMLSQKVKNPNAAA